MRIQITGACTLHHAEKKYMRVTTTKLAFWLVILLGLMTAVGCSRSTDSTAPKVTNAANVPNAPKVPNALNIPEVPKITTELGILNLNGYCKSLKQNEATVQEGNWVCMPGAAPIDMQAACQHSYSSSSNVIAKQRKSGDAFSWMCYSQK